MSYWINEWVTKVFVEQPLASPGSAKEVIFKRRKYMFNYIKKNKHFNIFTKSQHVCLVEYIVWLLFWTRYGSHYHSNFGQEAVGCNHKCMLTNRQNICILHSTQLIPLLYKGLFLCFTSSLQSYLQNLYYICTDHVLYKYHKLVSSHKYNVGWNHGALISLIIIYIFFSFSLFLFLLLCHLHSRKEK